MHVTHAEQLTGEIVAGVLVVAFLLDRLIRWAESHGARSYDDPTYVSGQFNPLFELFDPALQRRREIVEEKEVRGDESEADGAPPTPGDQPRGAGPTAF